MAVFGRNIGPPRWIFCLTSAGFVGGRGIPISRASPRSRTWLDAKVFTTIHDWEASCLTLVVGRLSAAIGRAAANEMLSTRRAVTDRDKAQRRAHGRWLSRRKPGKGSPLLCHLVTYRLPTRSDYGPATELCPERHNAPGLMRERVLKLTTVQANPTHQRPNPDFPTVSDDALGALKLARRWLTLPD